jgi:hypothetical protein
MTFRQLSSAIGSVLGRGAGLLIVLGVSVLSGCVSLRAAKHTYDTAASSPAVTVNGARVRLQLKPDGTSGGSYVVSAMVVSAAVATLDGPFRWRIEATGEAGRQESLILHRLRTRTETTRRDEWYPAVHLGRRVEFQSRNGANGVWRAVYDIPGQLRVKPREDGALEVQADLSVVANGRRKRRLVRFRLEPSQKRQDEFIFVPTEIVKSIGKSPAEWEDTGWD